MNAPPPQVPPTPPQAPVPSQPGAAPSAAPAFDDLEALGKPKGIPMAVSVALAIGGLAIGTAIGGLAFSGDADEGAAVSASASAPPPPKSSAPPPPPPKSLAEKAVEGDEKAFKELSAKAVNDRTGVETLAVFRGDLAQKRKALEEEARKIDLVKAFGESDDTQKKIFAAIKDPRQSVSTLEILAGLKGPMGPDYLYKVYKMRGRYKTTKALALELLHSKDIYDKASDALKITLDLNKAIDAEEKDCQQMIKLLVRAQADADTRAFSPIASLNRKRGCGDNKLKDCWECLRQDEGKDALQDAVKLARKNKAPL